MTSVNSAIVDKTATADPLVGQLLDGRYRIVARIARGGMATVYEATDLRLDRQTALKVLPETFGADEDFSQRFVREARAAARLAHPNVVAVYDQGEDNGMLFLAMEYVGGRHTLRDVIRDDAPLSASEALELLEQILQAIAAAHESGIIHRDIKPENVLISPRGQVKVADFGLARAISSATTATATGGVLMGTVSYLPPELVTDGTADARSDVYALGVLLFEMLTGTKPHEGESPIQVAYKHVHDDVPAPSTLASGIPPYLDALVARATARRRDLRPADAKVMLRQLRRVRHALDNGVYDDEELTADLTPTVAIGNEAFDQEAFDQQVFDQQVFDQEASADPVLASKSGDDRTVVVEQPETPTASTLETPTPDPRPASDHTPPPTPGRTDGHTGRRRSRGWIALVVVLLLAVGAGVAGWYYGVGRFQDTPDVTSMSQAAAKAELSADGLTLEVSSAAYSETVPEGHLITTDPAPSDRVLDNGTVHAVISKGPERHKVPDLSKMSEEEATKAITSHSLRVGRIHRRWSGQAPKGTVISFRPKAGKPLKRDTRVRLVVSKGPRPITIKSFVGSDAGAAGSWLSKRGFEVDVSKRYDDDVAAGEVISQRPRHGVGHRGDKVTLAVSKGPHLVEVPDVGNWGVSDAKAAITDAGFQVRVVENDPSFGLGFVVAQSVEGGSTAPYGSTITLTIV
ncbi:MAG: Stk1 family PASTA domain-containing Ser/Thr kinase [Nocardioidaceae bacterium]